MELKIKIVPTRITATTKEDLMAAIHRKFGGLGWSAGKDGVYHWVNIEGNERIVWTLQKYRPIIRQRKLENGNTVSKVVRSGYWEAHVYSFPKTLPICVKQKSRTFTIE